MSSYKNRGLGETPVTIPQEVRASPPNPSPMAAAIVKPQPVRASPLAAPRSNRQGIQTARPFPIAAVLQGLGDAPQVVAQPVASSAPTVADAAAAARLRRPQVPRASPLLPPGSIQQGLSTLRPFPVASVFQAGGLSAAPPVAIERLNAAATQTSRPDDSVSAQSRAARAAIMAAGVPVVGNYTSQIRSDAGGFAPPRMPRQGYMASGYSYPSQKMLIGATLAGRPVAVISSPSEDRKRILSGLMGLGAVHPRLTDPNSAEVKYCNGTYPVGVSAEQDKLNDLCRIDTGWFGSAPWTAKGKAERGLPVNWATLFKGVADAGAFLAKLPQAYVRVHGCAPSKERMNQWTEWAAKNTNWAASVAKSDDSMDKFVRDASETAQTKATRSFCAQTPAGTDTGTGAGTGAGAGAGTGSSLTREQVIAAYRSVFGCAPTDARVNQWLASSVTKNTTAAAFMEVLRANKDDLTGQFCATGAAGSGGGFRMPPASDDNTMLIVGGVAALAAVAFIATRK